MPGPKKNHGRGQLGCAGPVVHQATPPQVKWPLHLRNEASRAWLQRIILPGNRCSWLQLLCARLLAWGQVLTCCAGSAVSVLGHGCWVGPTSRVREAPALLHAHAPQGLMSSCSCSCASHDLHGLQLNDSSMANNSAVRTPPATLSCMHPLSPRPCAVRHSAGKRQLPAAHHARPCMLCMAMRQQLQATAPSHVHRRSPHPTPRHSAWARMHVLPPAYTTPPPPRPATETRMPQLLRGTWSAGGLPTVPAGCPPTRASGEVEPCALPPPTVSPRCMHRVRVLVANEAVHRLCMPLSAVPHPY